MNVHFTCVSRKITSYSCAALRGFAPISVAQVNQPANVSEAVSLKIGKAPVPLVGDEYSLELLLSSLFLKELRMGAGNTKALSLRDCFQHSWVSVLQENTAHGITESLALGKCPRDKNFRKLANKVCQQAVSLQQRKSQQCFTTAFTVTVK